MLRTRLRQQRLQGEHEQEKQSGRTTAAPTLLSAETSTKKGQVDDDDAGDEILDTSARPSARREGTAASAEVRMQLPSSSSSPRAADGDELTMQLTMQLSSLLKQKSTLTSDNDRLARENDQLHELLDYMMIAGAPDFSDMGGLASQDSFLVMEREDEFVFETPEKQDALRSPQRAAHTK